MSEKRVIMKLSFLLSLNWTNPLKLYDHDRKVGDMAEDAEEPLQVIID